MQTLKMPGVCQIRSLVFTTGFLTGKDWQTLREKTFLTKLKDCTAQPLRHTRKQPLTIWGLAVQYGGQPSRVVTDMTADVEPNQGTLQNFTSVQEAEAANLPKGTIITINGRKAVVE